MINVAAIGYDLTILAKNIKAMQDQAAELPASSEVREVEGGGSTPGQQNCTARLKEVSFRLATMIEGVRDFVAQNADTLNAAAESLAETDAEGDQAASRATIFLESAITTGPGNGGSRSSGSTGASGSGTSASGADGGGTANDL
ncbi:hypothetical protein [Microbacterium sp. GXF7504]